ncbi:hypothetical protein N9Y89_00770 [bacterium]|nr:hypothetical protein [bacterium]
MKKNPRLEQWYEAFGNFNYMLTGKGNKRSRAAIISRLHVDINLVNNDVLDIEAFKN